jgi:hypothetical protein
MLKFSVPQEFELVKYFKQAAKLHYCLTNKEALKLAFQYGEENDVVMPQNWLKSKCAGNIWLRGQRKCHESLC